MEQFQITKTESYRKEWQYKIIIKKSILMIREGKYDDTTKE